MWPKLADLASSVASTNAQVRVRFWPIGYRVWQMSDPEKKKFPEIHIHLIPFTYA